MRQLLASRLILQAEVETTGDEPDHCIAENQELTPVPFSAQYNPLMVSQSCSKPATAWSTSS